MRGLLAVDMNRSSSIVCLLSPRQEPLLISLLRPVACDKGVLWLSPAAALEYSVPSYVSSVKCFAIRRPESPRSLSSQPFILPLFSHCSSSGLCLPLPLSPSFPLLHQRPF